GQVPQQRRSRLNRTEGQGRLVGIRGGACKSDNSCRHPRGTRTHPRSPTSKPASDTYSPPPCDSLAGRRVNQTNRRHPMPTEAEVLDLCPCVGCDHHQRHYALVTLASFYAVAAQGQQPRIPTREELLAQCCKRDITDHALVSFTNFSSVDPRRR